MVNVDATNPGQFFACCGLLELAHRMYPRDATEGWFADGVFCVTVACSRPAELDAVFEALLNCQISDVDARGDRATRPVHLAAFAITLDWWIDDRGEKTPFKLWAGQQTSLRIVKDLCDALHGLADSGGVSLFNAGRVLTGRFGVDPRAAWNALDVGFSPNTQGMAVETFPAVELLAAVGLQRFRPVQVTQDGKPAFRYTTWSVPLAPSVAGAATAGLLPWAVVKPYRFRIAERGSYKGFGYAIPSGDET